MWCFKKKVQNYRLWVGEAQFINRGHYEAKCLARLMLKYEAVQNGSVEASEPEGFNDVFDNPTQFE